MKKILYIIISLFIFFGFYYNSFSNQNNLDFEIFDSIEELSLQDLNQRLEYIYDSGEFGLYISNLLFYYSNVINKLEDEKFRDILLSIRDIENILEYSDLVNYYYNDGYLEFVDSLRNIRFFLKGYYKIDRDLLIEETKAVKNYYLKNKEKIDLIWSVNTFDSLYFDKIDHILENSVGKSELLVVDYPDILTVTDTVIYSDDYGKENVLSNILFRGNTTDSQSNNTFKIFLVLLIFLVLSLVLNFKLISSNSQKKINTYTKR